MKFSRILTTLLYGVRERKGLCLLTGPVGSGKTLLLRKLAADNPTFRCLFLTNPWLSEQEFFSLLWQAWGEGDAPALANEPLSAIQQALARQTKKDEALRFVLLADEAHLLPERLLEAVRLLLNLEDERGKLIQIVLSGQEELALILKQHHMRPLLQRVALFDHLRPFSLDVTIGYVQHRLRTAGGDPYLFPRPCLEWIHQESRGVPRLINQICDHALIFAFGRESRAVERQDIEAALAKLPLGAVFLEPESASSPQRENPADAAKSDEQAAAGAASTPDLSPQQAAAADIPPEIPGLNAQSQSSPAAAPPFPPDGAARSPVDVAALGANVEAAPAWPSSSPQKGGGQTRGHSLAWGQWFLSMGIALLLGAGGAYWWMHNQSPSESSLGRTLGPAPSRTQTEGMDRLGPSRASDTPVRSDRADAIASNRSAPAPFSTASEYSRDNNTVATAAQPVPVVQLSTTLPLPVATHSTEQVVNDTKAALTAISNHFGADNTTVRDLFTAANPGVNLDRITANTRIRLPQFRRTDMIVADQRGRFYLYYATLADDQQAAAVKQRLAPLGVSVVQLPTMLGDQTVVRLYLGPFTDFDEAARVADLVRFTYLPLLERSGASGS